jgi:hypothetical protein
MLTVVLCQEHAHGFNVLTLVILPPFGKGPTCTLGLLALEIDLIPRIRISKTLHLEQGPMFGCMNLGRIHSPSFLRPPAWQPLHKKKAMHSFEERMAVGSLTRKYVLPV